MLKNLIAVVNTKRKAFGQDQYSSWTVNSIFTVFTVPYAKKVVIFKTFPHIHKE